jgi:hypothetical protein
MNRRTHSQSLIEGKAYRAIELSVFAKQAELIKHSYEPEMIDFFLVKPSLPRNSKASHRF